MALDHLGAQPRAQVWSMMERLYPTSACNFFMARHADYPPSAYVIDFDAPSDLGYILEYHLRCGLDGAIVHRPGWQMTVTVE